MSKVKLNLKINELNEQVDGILHNNKLQFLLNGKIVTICIFDNKITMKRNENDNEYTYINFEKEDPEAYYYFNKKFPLNIKILLLNIRHGIIEIKYIIENDEFYFKIEYKEGEI